MNFLYEKKITFLKKKNYEYEFCNTFFRKYSSFYITLFYYHIFYMVVSFRFL